MQWVRFAAWRLALKRVIIVIIRNYLRFTFFSLLGFSFSSLSVRSFFLPFRALLTLRLPHQPEFRMCHAHTLQSAN